MLRITFVLLCCGFVCNFLSAVAISEDSLRDTALKLINDSKPGGDLPKGVSIRVWADMSGPKEPKTLSEHWEFSAGQVHSMVHEAETPDKPIRFKSKDYKTSGLMFALKKGRFSKIEAREGMGEFTLLEDTPFETGGRSITVLINGKVALVVVEHCTIGGYRETNSKALTKLYESLATKARKTFAKDKESK